MDKCYISDHTDIAIGINAKSKNVDAAKTFLSWVASPEFAEIYANALPGFFPLSNAKVSLKDPVAKFASWRGTCESSIRNSYQILSRGTPNLENELWNVSAQILNSTMKPEEAAKKVQDGLASWYPPANRSTRTCAGGRSGLPSTAWGGIECRPVPPYRPGAWRAPRNGRASRSTSRCFWRRRSSSIRPSPSTRSSTRSG